MDKNTKVMILAAGKGKRLGFITRYAPKPMLKIHNMPILEHIINYFKGYGIKNFVINLHYRHKKITEYFKGGEKFNIKINYSYEKRLLGTAGAVKKAQRSFNKTFIVGYGDTIRKCDLNRIFRFHKKKKSKITIALYKTTDTKRSGMVSLDNKMRIRNFIEKPTFKLNNQNNRWANAGLYIIEPQILNYIPKGKYYDFAYDLFPKLLKSKVPMHGYKTYSPVFDCGNIKGLGAFKKNGL